VTNRRGGTAARQDELLERRQVAIQVIQQILEASHLGFRQDNAIRHTQFAAQIEELVLNLAQRLLNGFRQVMRQQQAEDAIQFIHRPEGFYPGTVLGDARAIAQTGRAVVASAGVDFGEPMSHV
jgi:hypothetical protein